MDVVVSLTHESVTKMFLIHVKCPINVCQSWSSYVGEMISNIVIHMHMDTP